MKSARLALILLAASPLAMAQELHFPPARSVDMKHLELRVKTDVASRSLQGRALWRLRTIQSIESLRLDAVAFEVASLKLRHGEKELPCNWQNSGEELILEFAKIDAGTELSLEIQYKVTAPKQGLYFRGPSPEDPLVPLQLWSQGEDFENRHWIPCIDHPDERQSTELIVEAPRAFEVLSNGRLLSCEELGDEKRWHWKQDEEHVIYLVSLVIGRFEVRRQNWKGKELSSYTPLGWGATAENSFANTGKMIDLFESLTGQPYPWAKYAQIVVEQFTFGGMENTSATTLHGSTLHDDRAHLDTRSDGLVAHELAHQWFGDLLTCRDWAHVWLNEGFATYFEALWARENEGPDEFRYNMFQKSFGALGGGKKGPIVDRAWKVPMDNFDGRAYPKGAWVLHMLREALGEAVFWQGIRHYITRHRQQSVETSDLRRSLEAASGASLGRFFHDRVERKGDPHFKAKFEWLDRERLLKVELSQIQAEDAFHHELELEIQVPGEERPRKQVLPSTEKQSKLFVPLPKRPQRLRIDPREAILKELTVEMAEDWWFAQLRSDPDIIGRIRAARELATRRREPITEVLCQQLDKDPSDHVRYEIAKALSEPGGERVRKAFIKGLKDRNHRVRRACVEGLGRMGQSAEAWAELKKLSEADDPALKVEVELVSALASCGGEGAESEMRRALELESHSDQLRERAIRGISQWSRATDWEIFLKHSAPEYPFESRRAAFQALGKVASDQRLPAEALSKILARLDRALGDSSQRVRSAALEALAQIGQQAAGAAREKSLQALSKHDPDDELREAAKKALAALRSGRPSDPALDRLQRRLEELERERAADRERIEKLEAQAEERKGR
jgi:aminopeptidase N